MNKKRIMVMLILCVWVVMCHPTFASAKEDSLSMFLQKYEAYQEGFAAIKSVEDIEENGYEIVENQTFPILLESFSEEEVTFYPIMDKKYHRLVVLIADQEGKVLFKTDQLETNYKYLSQLEQPTTGILF